MDKMTEQQIAELLQTLKYIAWNLKTLAEQGLTVKNVNVKETESHTENLHRRLEEQKKAQYPFNQVED